MGALEAKLVLMLPSRPKVVCILGTGRGRGSGRVWNMHTSRERVRTRGKLRICLKLRLGPGSTWNHGTRGKLRVGVGVRVSSLWRISSSRPEISGGCTRVELGEGARAALGACLRRIVGFEFSGNG